WCSRPWCLAESVWPRLPATECRLHGTILVLQVLTRTTESPWRLSNVAKSRGLGRGLAALVAEFPAGQISMVEIELSQVRPSPRQPRRSFDEESIGQLAESIKSDGIVQPIVVRDAGDGYEIVAGERRWR